ncbi:hypothetical protein KZ686_23790 [Cupriavidus cauae]|uniref:hypothetical protein n=1 Tax=Cupriavidus TaxID=106589 RepID=UPI001CF13A04|nr:MULTISPECIES: hypothetical protein [Cupriavidus]MCA7082644.1 hypothetical protein [Cupriavidus sp. DB3]UZN51342.1 hypothetical protein KZ686_23790 [Cupriavidus cauae]
MPIQLRTQEADLIRHDDPSHRLQLRIGARKRSGVRDRRMPVINGPDITRPDTYFEVRSSRCRDESISSNRAHLEKLARSIRQDSIAGELSMTSYFPLRSAGWLGSPVFRILMNRRHSLYRHGTAELAHAS